MSSSWFSRILWTSIGWRFTRWMGSGCDASRKIWWIEYPSRQCCEAMMGQSLRRLEEAAQTNQALVNAAHRSHLMDDGKMALDGPKIGPLPPPPPPPSPPPSSACLPLSFGPERQLFRRLFFFTLRWSHRLASTAIYSFAGFLYNAIHFTWVYWVKHDSLFFWSMGFHCFTVYYVVTICNCKVWSSFTGFIRRFCGFFLFFLGFTWFYRSIWFNAIFLNATILHFGWDRLCDINWAASSFKHVLSVIRASISDTSEMRVSHARELRHSALWNIWPNATGLHNLFLILFALSHLFS